MNESPPTDRETLKSLNNELARERNRAAAERTLMAWIRTCLALIGFGVGIDQFVSALYYSLGGQADPSRISRFLGLAFVLLGTFAMTTATREHLQTLRHIARGNFTYSSRRSLGVIVSICLGVIGGIASIWLAANLARGR